MQLREGSFHGARPACPKDKGQMLHRHGCYERYAGCEGRERLSIQRYRCPACRHTFGVLPENRLPYIALTAGKLQADFDARSSGTDPPPGGEKGRAFKRFASRVAVLCALLGQMIEPIKPGVCECWRALRHLDNLEGILLLLFTKFNTSLLADYRCFADGALIGARRAIAFQIADGKGESPAATGVGGTIPQNVVV
jgi:hypothetical protein